MLFFSLLRIEVISFNLFSHFTSQVRMFFVEERKPNIFGFKNAMERGIKKCLTFVIRQIASKIFRGNNIQALVISKRL